jgi:hypothetical protein
LFPSGCCVSRQARSAFVVPLPNSSADLPASCARPLRLWLHSPRCRCQSADPQLGSGHSAGVPSAGQCSFSLGGCPCLVFVSPRQLTQADFHLHQLPVPQLGLPLLEPHRCLWRSLPPTCFARLDQLFHGMRPIQNLSGPLRQVRLDQIPYPSAPSFTADILSACLTRLHASSPFRAGMKAALSPRIAL